MATFQMEGVEAWANRVAYEGCPAPGNPAGPGCVRCHPFTVDPAKFLNMRDLEILCWLMKKESEGLGFWNPFRQVHEQVPDERDDGCSSSSSASHSSTSRSSRTVACNHDAKMPRKLKATENTNLRLRKMTEIKQKEAIHESFAALQRQLAN